MWKVEMYSKGVDITLLELRKIGKELGILFPPDYEMFVLMGLAGGQPNPNRFLIRPDMGYATLSQFIDPQEIAAMLDNAPHLYGNDLIPVAQEGTGDNVCFKRNGSGVYYVAHEYLDDPERARTLLAPTWSDFIETVESQASD
jgi:SMI1-KNR4 cell-wall